MNITPNTIDIDGNNNKTSQAGNQYRKNVTYQNPPDKYNKSNKYCKICKLYHKIIITNLIVLTLFVLVGIILMVVLTVKVDHLQGNVMELKNLINYNK